MFTTLDCGCKVPREADVIGIEFCPMHAAAPLLLEALRIGRTFQRQVVVVNRMHDTNPDYVPESLKQASLSIRFAKLADAALAAVEGDDD